MGRTRSKKKSSTKVSGPPIIQPPLTAAPAPSISALLEKAQSLIVECDYELALRFLRRILEQNQAHAEAKELLGVALLETGEIEKAKEVVLFLLLFRMN